MISIIRDEVVDTIKNNDGQAFKAVLQQVEKVVIEEALITCRGNQTKAAKMLGIGRMTLRKYIKLLGVRK